MPSAPSRPPQHARAEAVAVLARRGLAQKAIAHELGISEATVSRALASRERTTPAQIAHRLARVTALTAAERAVAGLALAGRTNAEIARLRGRSTRTIANQLASTYRKLGVGSRLGLRAAVEHGARSGTSRKK